MTAQERLVAAARDFCREEMSIRSAKAWDRERRRKCDFRASPEFEVGFMGNPPCDEATEGKCDPCQAAFGSAPSCRGSLRKRKLAKERMLRAARSIEKREARG